jgi:KDO2-lipid IV(A) lauroyltransferase
MSADGWKRFKHRLELLGVRFLTWLPLLLPYSASVRVGGVIGAFAFDVVRIRRRVTLDNLERALGDELSLEERIRTGRRSYINFAKSMIELASFRRLGRERLVELVRFHDFERIESALSEGKGLLVVTGHFGSWELFGASAAARGLPVDFIVGEQTNTLVDEYINGLRRSAGLGIIYKGIAVRGVFESLKKNRVIAILSDQDARRSGIFVDFFGIQSSTYPGVAHIAWKTGCPIIYGSIVRRSDGTHDASFGRAMHADTEKGREEEAERLIAEITKMLEDSIRRNPDHYFWAHRRWKTAPPAEAIP